MDNIYIMLIVLLIAWYFFFLRKIAESARIYAEHYCKQHDLQYISVARIKTRLKFNFKSGLYWLSEFIMEFSGDGQSSNSGLLWLKNNKIVKLDLPAYRIS